MDTMMSHPEFDKKSRFGIRTKVALGLGSLVLGSLLMMGGAAYWEGLTLARKNILDTTREELLFKRTQIENELHRAINDLLVVSSTPPISGIIRARDHYI